MGLRPWEFARYTLREFFNALIGNKETENEGWAQARLIAAYAIAPYWNKEDNGRLELRKIWPIPEIDGKAAEFDGLDPEKSTKIHRLTPEEIEQWQEGTWVPPEMDNGEQ